MDVITAWLGLAALLTSAVPGARSLSAQSSTELGPFVGFFAPLSTFEGPYGPVLPGSNNYKHQVAVALGGQASFWINEHLGLALQLGLSSSDVRQEQISADTSVPASVWWIGAAIAFKVTPPDLANDVRLRAGAGYMQHSGSAFAPYSSPGSLSALLGIEASMPLWAEVRVFAGLDAYMYSLQLTDALGVRYDSRFQADMVARIGLLWTLTRAQAAPN